MSLAHESRAAECKEIIQNLGHEYGQSYVNQVDDLFQLVEILSRRQDERALPVKLPEWTCHLDTQGKKYLEDIVEIQGSTNTCTNYSLLISRFSEYLLRQ